MTLQTKSGSYAPESYGDNIAVHLPQIASALDGTTGAHTIRGPIVRLGVSGSAPMFDEDMVLIVSRSILTGF